MRIERDRHLLFTGSTGLTALRRKPEELLEWLFRSQSFPEGAVLLTGTGIVPPNDVRLEHGDIVTINCPPIGTLRSRADLLPSHA
jgi:2-dehydro-3-deoxy-D-arabinonate dehydratase